MIKEYIEQLNQLKDSDWCRYAFQGEPLSSKFTPAQCLEYYRGAVDCGASLAMSLKERMGGLTIQAFAEKEGINVVLDDTEIDGIYTVFATFSEPNDIKIFRNNAKATDRLIEQNGLSSVVGNVKTEDLLLAHELFHYYENHKHDLYIHKKHVLLFKIWRFENRSRILCLAEIAAMAFARVLTGLPCSPYLYDILMLYSRNPQRARQQYEKIIKITTGG